MNIWRQIDEKRYNDASDEYERRMGIGKFAPEPESTMYSPEEVAEHEQFMAEVKRQQAERQAASPVEAQTDLDEDTIPF